MSGRSWDCFLRRAVDAARVRCPVNSAMLNGIIAGSGVANRRTPKVAVPSRSQLSPLDILAQEVVCVG